MLLALVILAMALPVLLGLANRDIEILGHARALTAATLLAQEKLLETEVMGFPPVGQQTGDFRTPPPGMRIEHEVDARREVFRWTRIVDPTPVEELREVRVRISWPRGETEQMVEVTTYVFLEPRSPSPSRIHAD